MVKQPLLVVVGPTGIGKSAIAIEVAKRLRGEILSVDSMQVYRGMDVGTAKPTPKEQKGVSHHGIGLIEPTEDFTASAFRQYALQILEEVVVRKHLPILVGGTGLYLRALLDGLCAAPSGDPQYRQKLTLAVARHGAHWLHQELKIKDPLTAKRLHPNDTRRVIRALEVSHLSGKPLSTWQRETKGLAARWRVKLVGLTQGREALYERINQRVDQMLKKGLVQEAKRLHRRRLSKTARQAIGYKELYAHLEGRWDLDEAIEKIRQESRRYAKRQMTWFRKDKRVQWIVIQPGQTAIQVANQVVKQYRKGCPKG